MAKKDKTTKHITSCAACGAPIVWLSNGRGSFVPVDAHLVKQYFNDKFGLPEHNPDTMGYHGEVCAEKELLKDILRSREHAKNIKFWKNL